MPGDAVPCRCRFIPLTAGYASMNMAVDEALLLSYLNHFSPQTIRVYGWSRPSVTFGYRIDPVAVDTSGFPEIDVVRRQTGGGVVYHGECATVAVAGGVSSLEEWAGRNGLPRKWVNRSSLLYRAVNSVVGDALSALGVRNSLVPGSTSWNAGIDCFSNPCAYDIVADGRKIYGAAQMRLGGAFLYQGNLLMEDGFDTDGFCELLREGLGAALGWEIVEGELSKAEKEEAQRLCRVKYESGGWNRLGSTPPGRPGRPEAGGPR